MKDLSTLIGQGEGREAVHGLTAAVAAFSPQGRAADCVSAALETSHRLTEKRDAAKLAFSNLTQDRGLAGITHMGEAKDIQAPAVADARPRGGQQIGG